MALTKRKFLPVMKYCTYNYFVFGKKKTLSQVWIFLA